MAPAAALATVGVTCTDRCRGSTTPVTPAHSAGPQQRAEVAGVGHAVDGEQERRHAVRAASRAVVEVDLLGAERSRARTPCGASVRAAASSSPARRLLDRDTRGLVRQVDDIGEDRAASSTSSASQHLVDPAAAGERAARGRPDGPRPGRRRVLDGRRRRRRPRAGSGSDGRRRLMRRRRRARPPSRRCLHLGPSAPRPSARFPFTVTGAPRPSDRRSLHLRRSRRQLRRLEHDRAVDVDGRPARGANAVTRPAASSAMLSAPASAGRCRGSDRRCRPGPRRPAARRRTAWATTSASLCPASPRSPSNMTPPRTSGTRRVVTKACTSKPCPTRSSRTAAPRPRGRHGSVTLRLSGSPSTTSPWRRSARPARRRRCPLLAAVGRAQHRRSETLRRLHGDQRRTVDGAAVDLAQRVGHRNDRNDGIGSGRAARR